MIINYLCVYYINKQVKELYMKKIFTFFLLAAVAFTLSGCGKAANPVPYPDYPRTYPYDK